VRIGREAQRDNAATVRAISDDYDRSEAALHRARRREARFRVAFRLLWIAVLVALAIVAMLGWQPA
jgi:hypothetical protein